MSAAERTKDRSNLLQHWEGRVLGLSSATSRKVLSDRPALKPDWGKPTVRNFRGEDGNGSYRAILLPERKAETPKRPSLSLRLRAPYLYPDQRRDLLVAMGPDRRHPVKAVASRAPASRLAALTGCRRPGRGLASR